MMEWDVKHTNQFEAWWDSLNEDERVDVRAKILLVRQFGPRLGRPHADTVRLSKHPNMKELRIQHKGRPYRVLFAFDPTRSAILLIGGDKTGQKRWYQEFVPVADRLYNEHIQALKRGG